MKLIKETASELVLQEGFKPGSALIGVVMTVGLLAIAPLLYLVSGTNTIQCMRTGARTADCEISQNRPFNISVPDSYTLHSVQGATLRTETREDDEGRSYTVYQVALIADDSMEYPVSVFTKNVSQMGRIQDRLNSELASTNAFWEVQAPSGLPPAIPFLVLPITAAFAWFTLSVSISELGSTTISLNQTTQQVTQTKKHFLGFGQNSIQHYSLQGVTVDFSAHEDSDDDLWYEVSLLIPPQKFKLIFTMDAQKADQLQTRLTHFLRQPPLPTPTSKRQKRQQAYKLFYEGEQVEFQTAGLTEIPTTASSSIRLTTNQLLQLGFQFLGDLKTDRFMGAQFYCFAYVDSFAIVMEHPTENLDFYTAFMDGASLTTTQMKLSKPHFKSQQIYRYAHPNTVTPDLFQLHQQKIREMSLDHSRPQPIKADLQAIAIAIDNYLVRESKAKGRLFGF